MAGDWIKIREDLKDDFAVARMAKALALDKWGIVGRLSDIWAWVGRHTADGVSVPVDSEMIDTHVNCPGFADAMRLAEWLKGENGALIFPKWDRHNSNSAKARALESEAKRLRRTLTKPERKKAEKVVRHLSDNRPTKEDENVGPEKRREEYIGVDKSTPTAGAEKKVKKPGKPPSREYLALKSQWAEGYKAAHGDAYFFQGGKDSGALTALVNTKLGVDHLMRIANAAWKNPTGYSCKAAATLSGFRSKLNDIRVELNNSRTGEKQPRPESEKGKW